MPIFTIFDIKLGSARFAIAWRKRSTTETSIIAINGLRYFAILNI
jgi:hypothetical protein